MLEVKFIDETTVGLFVGEHLMKKFNKHDVVIDQLFFTMYDYILSIEELDSERVYSYKVDTYSPRTYKLFLNGKLVDGGFSEKELVKHMKFVYKTLYRYYYLLVTEGV